MNKILKIILLFMLCAPTVFADTIITKDGRELKGIIVEEYRDRIVFSTADGEITMLDSDIERVHFDEEEDNLLKLAEQAEVRDDYDRAYSYYHMATKLNPASKRAVNGMARLQKYFMTKDEMKKEDEVRWRNELESRGQVPEAFIISGEPLEAKEKKLFDTTGIVLKLKGNFPQVATVGLNSLAYGSGIRRGDLLVAVWGRLTGYMTLGEVIDMLLEKSTIEMRCAVEKEISVAISDDRGIFANPKGLIGASLGMEFEGLTVTEVEGGESAAAGGVEKGDLILAIDGKSMRYMPINEAIALIKNSQSNKVKLTIRRDVTIWRERR